MLVARTPIGRSPIGRGAIEAAGGGFTTLLASKATAEQPTGTGHGVATDSLTLAGLVASLSAGSGLTTNLASRTLTGQAAGTGHGTALEARTLAGLVATLAGGAGFTTIVAAKAVAEQSAATGNGTALEQRTITALVQALGSAGSLTTSLASLSKAGQGAALGLLTALDGLSIVEREQILGLLTSTASVSLSEFPANLGGASVSTNLGALVKAAHAAGLDVWELGDAIEQAYHDLDQFFDAVTGLAETVRYGSVELSGLFDDDAASGGELAGPQLWLTSAAVDAHAIDQGSLLVVRGRTFSVAGVQRDGVGTALLPLIEVR